MILSEISPYIRHAQIRFYEGTDTPVCAYDYRLFYIISGIFSVNNSFNELSPGTLLFLQAGVPYHFMLNSPVELLVLNFDLTQTHLHINRTIPPSKVNEFDSSKALPNILFSDFEFLNTIVVRKNMEFFESSLRRIVNEYETKLLFYEEKSSSILKTVILDMARDLQFNSLTIPLKLKNTLQYIESHYARELSNDELAHISGYHPYHLNRLMLNYTGVSLHQYLINYRLEKSKSLLSNEILSISEISELCGFNSPYYYSNAFKKKFGLSPSVYRKHVGNLL